MKCGGCGHIARKTKTGKWQHAGYHKTCPACGCKNAKPKESVSLTKNQLAEICAYYKTGELRPDNKDIQKAAKFLKGEWEDIKYSIGVKQERASP